MPKTNEQVYEEAEAELTRAAIEETEQEVFDDALGNVPDENTGDTSLEEMDDQELDADEPEEEAEEAAAEDETQDAGEEPEVQDVRGEQQERRGSIPSSRLKQEADARRTAEAERDTLRAQMGELQARMQLLERNGPRQPQQQQEPPPAPDMFADPEGWARHREAQIIQRMEAQQVERSLQAARAENTEQFDRAYNALAQANDPHALAQIRSSYNPGRALIDWHNRQQLLSDVGNDPAAYRERVRQELMADPAIRQQILSGMREDAQRGDGSGPRTRTRLPASLNGASGGAGHRTRDPGSRRGGGFSASDEREIADSVWDN
jgi:hypothetical protein